MTKSKKANDQNRWNQIIAVYEMVGGLLGLGLTLFYGPSLVSISPILFWFVFIAVLMYCLIFYSGLLIWKKQRKGLILSKWAQIVQVPNFSIYGLTYYLTAGLAINLKLANSEFGVSFFAGSSWKIYLSSDSDVFLIAINIIPLLILNYLLKEIKKSKWK